MNGFSRETAVRIERADQDGLYRLATLLEKIEPGLRVRVARPGGGCLLAMGRDWPVNRASGVGYEGPVGDDTIDAAEALFEQADVPAAFELSPLDDPGFAVRLDARGYKRTAILCLYAIVPGRTRARAPGIRVERVDARTAPLYEVTVARGFMHLDDGEPGAGSRVFARAAATSGETVAMLASIGGEAAGGGALGIRSGVASLFGMSTLPKFRRRGVQRALLEARLAAAAEAGCDLASVKTEPGTGSERNVRRAGFTLVHEQTIWRRQVGPNHAPHN